MVCELLVCCKLLSVQLLVLERSRDAAYLQDFAFLRLLYKLLRVKHCCFASWQMQVGTASSRVPLHSSLSFQRLTTLSPGYSSAPSCCPANKFYSKIQSRRSLPCLFCTLWLARNHGCPLIEPYEGRCGISLVGRTVRCEKIAVDVITIKPVQTRVRVADATLF